MTVRIIDERISVSFVATGTILETSRTSNSLRRRVHLTSVFLDFRNDAIVLVARGFTSVYPCICTPICRFVAYTLIHAYRQHVGRKKCRVASRRTNYTETFNEMEKPARTERSESLDERTFSKSVLLDNRPVGWRSLCARLGQSRFGVRAYLLTWNCVDEPLYPIVSFKIALDETT